MSATDELRAELTRRGVEWMDDSYAQLWCTVWHGQDGKQWRMTENQSGMLTELKAWKATPAQAIAATLGAGTCHLKPWEMERDTGFYDSMECDCGYVADVADWASWHFCPSCGRQNVGVDE